MIRLRHCLLFAFLLLLPLASSLHAQPAPTPRPVSPAADDWRRSLDQVQAALKDNDLSREQFDALRARIDAIRQAAEQARAEADAQRKPLNDQLAALGPAPDKSQPPELAEVARQRKQLVDQIALYDSRIKQAELTIARAGGFQVAIARIGNRQITQRLLARDRPPLSFPVITAGMRELGEVAAAVANAPIAWWSSSTLSELEPVNLAWLAFVFLAALGAGWPLRNWLLRRFGHRPELTDPSYARRVLAAGVEALARGLLPAAGLLALAGVLVSQEIVSELLANMVTGVLGGITFFSLTSAFARAALAPEAPAWRIVPFGAEASLTLSRRLSALAAAAAVAIGIGIATRNLRDGAPELFNLVALFFDSLIALLTFALLQRRLWQPDAENDDDKRSEPTPTSPFWPVLRLLIGLALLAVPVLSLLGYHHLASHIVSRVVFSGLLAGALLLLRTLLRELLALIMSPESLRSTRLRGFLALTEQGSKILLFWLQAAFDLVLIFAGLAVALGLWGVPIQAIELWASSALLGFTIGNLHLSLADIALAVVVFSGFLTATRLVQRLLTEKLLPQTRLDPGVRHSLSAGLGYIGFIVATAFAISTLGLSLSNVAIIAGALSVGIGFGLQNIVNNFVSGLILLIERPIRVGDWVVVGQHQGYVTRIAVRSTEIETFQRASVIIPNSELLSGAVVNWTHRDKYGRFDVQVSVAYGSDTEKVRDLLLECARDHRQVLSWPAPYVLFTNFGDSALVFELRGYIADVEQRQHVASDLHFAIDSAFRKAGIQMPFPQRDLTLRNIDELARALAGLRGSGERAGNGTQPIDGIAPNLRHVPPSGEPPKA